MGRREGECVALTTDRNGSRQKHKWEARKRMNRLLLAPGNVDRWETENKVAFSNFHRTVGFKTKQKLLGKWECMGL